MASVRSDPAEVKARFLAQRGGWPPAFDDLVRLDPAFVEAYLDFSTAPWKSGALEPKVREFIYIAIDISTTHLHAGGARAHIAAAIRHGATREELVDVCELAVLLGVHTMTMAVPILVEELAASGQPVRHEPDEAGEAVRRRYVDDRGALPPPLEPLLTMHPEYLDAYRALSGLPLRRGTLSAKVIELIVIAMDAATTHLHVDGTRAHIRNALALGVTGQEILEVLELTSVLGIHGTNLGIELVSEAFSAQSS